MATDIPELNRTPDKSAPEISPAERFFTMTNGGKLPATSTEIEKRQADFLSKTRANMAALRDAEQAAYLALPVEERLKPAPNPWKNMTEAEMDAAIKDFVNHRRR